MMLSEMVLEPVMCTSASSRTPEMPMGFLMPLAVTMNSLENVDYPQPSEDWCRRGLITRSTSFC
jgi:hypothetical protein